MGVLSLSYCSLSRTSFFPLFAHYILRLCRNILKNLEIGLRNIASRGITFSFLIFREIREGGKKHGGGGRKKMHEKMFFAQNTLILYRNNLQTLEIGLRSTAGRSIAFSFLIFRKIRGDEKKRRGKENRGEKRFCP